MATAGQQKIVSIGGTAGISVAARLRKGGESDVALMDPPTTRHSSKFIDTTEERRDMWLPKRRGLPFMFWILMLKGRA